MTDQEVIEKRISAMKSFEDKIAHKFYLALSLAAAATTALIYINVFYR